MSEDGNFIYEKNDLGFIYKQDNKKIIVFMKYKDPLGFNEYKFIGIFEFDKEIKNSNVFKKVSDVCKLIK